MGEPTFSCVLWSSIYHNNDIPKGFYNNSSSDNGNISPSAAPHFAGLIQVGISYLLFCIPTALWRPRSFELLLVAKHSYLRATSLSLETSLAPPPCSQVEFENGRLVVAHPDHLQLLPRDGCQHFCPLALSSFLTLSLANHGMKEQRALLVVKIPAFLKSVCSCFQLKSILFHAPFSSKPTVARIYLSIFSATEELNRALWGRKI